METPYVLLHVRSTNSGKEEIHIVFQTEDHVRFLSPIGRALAHTSPSAVCGMRLSLPSYVNDGKQLDLGPNHDSLPNTSFIVEQLPDSSPSATPSKAKNTPEHTVDLAHTPPPSPPPRTPQLLPPIRHMCTVCNSLRKIEAFSIFQTDKG